MLRYTGSNEKVKLQVTLPDGTEYTYPVTDSDTDSRLSAARRERFLQDHAAGIGVCGESTSTRFLLPRIWM